jgi:hypothetical protein
VLFVRLARNGLPSCAYAFWRAVFARFGLFFAVQLDKDCIIDIGSKRAVYSLYIGLKTVCGQLYAIGKPIRHVSHEYLGVTRVPQSYEPRDGQFGVGIYRYPRPNVAIAELTLLVLGYVFLPRIAVTPDFVTLYPLTIEVAKNLVLIFGANGADILQELNDLMSG